MNSRERVLAALEGNAYDRIPVDFLATTEIWEKLESYFSVPRFIPKEGDYFDASWEDILRKLEVDCRVVSYDQFCEVPEDAFPEKGRIEYWKVLSRSTPARMWRFVTDDGSARDIFGRCFRVQKNANGSYEENLPVLSKAESVEDLRSHRWPDPSWWNFSALPAVIERMNEGGAKHIRYRMGSVFEVAWQLRGMDTFFMDLALQPEIPVYIMNRITEICEETAEKALSAAGDAIDMVYFYDDIASNSGLMISEDMWKEFIKPCHERLIAVAKRYGKKVMYHSDGSLSSAMDALIDMGIDVLNPIQPNTKGMDPGYLKEKYGDRLSFHGGIDIVELLPRGTQDQVKAEAVRMRTVLGERGGYIMSSSHHIQPDTPLENVLALYDTALR